MVQQNLQLINNSTSSNYNTEGAVFGDTKSNSKKAIG